MELCMWLLGMEFCFLGVVYENWSVQLDSKIVFSPDNPTSPRKLVVEIRDIKSTPYLSFSIIR